MINHEIGFNDMFKLTLYYCWLLLGQTVCVELCDVAVMLMSCIIDVF